MRSVLSTGFGDEATLRRLSALLHANATALRDGTTLHHRIA
jgi:hypothetical protein